jgi:hypothetical protein
MVKRLLSALIFVSSALIPFSVQSQDVLPKDGHLQYMGRLGMKGDSIAEMYWSGSSVKLNFHGTGIKAILKDQRANNFLNVVIDNDSIYKLELDTAKKEYVLANNLSKGKHSVELYKITEYDRGKISFYGFQLNKGDKVLDPLPVKKRRIEVYGNSITCGYGVEDTVGDSPASTFENNYVSYAALTARHFDAAYSFIAKSGIGITISWFPYTMPEIYDRLDPDDPLSKWDFSLYTPDIVVVNLFQNDSWLVNMPNHTEFKRVFGPEKPKEAYFIEAYRRFIKSIRNKYPEANIICALGNMDATKEGSVWPGYIKQAVSSLEDKKIYTHFFRYKNTPGHPKIREQKVMADSLIEFIEKTFKW